MTADDGSGAEPAGAMQGRSALLLTLGAVILAVLLAAHDAGKVIRLLADVGWRVLVVVAAHLPQTLTAALGWSVLFARPERPPLGEAVRLRWIKEAVNSLLPVAQVGGDLARAKLATRSGLSLVRASASCLVDVATGTLSLLIFALCGIAALCAREGGAELSDVGFRTVAASAGAVALIALALRLGLLRLLEKLVRRGKAPKLDGLHAAAASFWGHPRRLIASGAWHLVSWSLGVVETYAALWALGLSPTWEMALIIEGMGVAIRALGFAVPGALGVQEGGYILVCGLFGLSAEQALALSLLRRLRELALGLPGLLVWRWSARKPGAGAPQTVA